MRSRLTWSPVSTPTSRSTEGIPERERLPCGCDRLSGWCVGWPEGSWTAAGHWLVLAGTAAKWPAPELHSCFSPDAEESKVITNPAKSMQNALCALCPPPSSLPGPQGKVMFHRLQRTKQRISEITNLPQHRCRHWVQDHNSQNSVLSPALILF